MRFLLLFIVLFVLVCAPAHATTEKSVLYVKNTLANVSDVLLGTGILKIDDPATLDEYVRIHQCGLYEQYGSDDFAWARIREAQGRDLKTRLSDLPTGLEVSSSLYIDQYDFTNNAFKIHPDYLIENVGAIVGFSSEGGGYADCQAPDARSFVPRTHPLNLRVKIQEPITFYSVPMDRDIADKLIASLKEKNKGSNLREITMVVRVRIIGEDPLAIHVNATQKHVLGNLHDIRFYEGPERKLLLYTKEYETLKSDK